MTEHITRDGEISVSHMRRENFVTPNLGGWYDFNWYIFCVCANVRTTIAFETDLQVDSSVSKKTHNVRYMPMSERTRRVRRTCALKHTIDKRTHVVIVIDLKKLESPSGVEAATGGVRVATLQRKINNTNS